MSTTVGVLGVGNLAAYMLRGLRSAGFRFVLSPRGAEMSASLSARYGHPVATDNQAVVDAADAVLVCLPAATGLRELARLRFRPGTPVLSAMAGTELADLAAAVAPARAAVAMMPGYANALGLGPSIICPGDPFWQDFLAATGPVHVLEDPRLFCAAASFGAFSGASVAFMAHVTGWFVAQGMAPEMARQLVAGTVRGNAEVLLREPAALEDIAKGVTTTGGITLQLVDHLVARGALDAWDEGLDAISARLGG